VDVPSGRVGLDSRKVVCREVEQVLPIVVLVVAFGRRAPLDEEQGVGLLYVARRFVNLERKDL
jgi:hypothetical protein